MDDATLNSLVLALTTIVGAVVTAFSVAFIIWTYNDMKARSRDPLAQVAAALVVAVLNIFGLIIYVMLRPRETLADAYERSLEEEALLQEIEEKPACPGCGRPSKHHWQACPYCHTRLKKPCYQCDELLELSWNLCPACGTVQSEASSDGREVMLAGGEAQQPARQRRRDITGQRSPYEVSPPQATSPQVPEQSPEWVDGNY